MDVVCAMIGQMFLNSVMPDGCPGGALLGVLCDGFTEEVRDER